jgi:hypothetical protein
VRIIFIVCILAGSCSHGTGSQRVEILPVPSATASEAALSWPSEDEACKPESIDVVDLDGAPDALSRPLAAARRFAERCCVGDESGDAIVTVTFAPEGYGTTVAIEPERLASGPTGACLSASFHRVTTRTFAGDERKVTIPVHVTAPSR